MKPVDPVEPCAPVIADEMSTQFPLLSQEKPGGPRSPVAPISPVAPVAPPGDPEREEKYDGNCDSYC